jgi:hypothetical protein
MKIIRCFLFFLVILSYSCDRKVNGLTNDAPEGQFENVELNSSPKDEGDENDESTSGTKKFDEPSYSEQQSSNTNLKDTSSIVNENLPEIKGQDISPEQEILMAATQDSSYQEANMGDATGQDLDTIAGRTLQQTSTPDTQEKGDIDSQDVLDNDDPLSSDSLLGFGNFSQNGGDSEDLSDDPLGGATRERQVINRERHLIHYPSFHVFRHFQPLLRTPRPYPATIHVRLPGDVHTVPRVYPVHDYRHFPVPVRYHKVQNVDSPYYVPYKSGPDVEETHLEVYQPSK